MTDASAWPDTPWAMAEWPGSPVATLLPPSASGPERAMEQSTAPIGDVPVPLRTLWSADNCPANLLPWLAWGLGIEIWEPGWDDERKRQAIREAVDDHRYRGTIGAVKKALVDYPANIIEWFADSPKAPPYTFVIDFTNLPQEDVMAEIIRLVEKTKNVRSKVFFRRVVDGEFKVADLCVSGETVSVADSGYASDWQEAYWASIATGLHNLVHVTLPDRL